MFQITLTKLRRRRRRRRRRRLHHPIFFTLDSHTQRNGVLSSPQSVVHNWSKSWRRSGRRRMMMRILEVSGSGLVRILTKICVLIVTSSRRGRRRRRRIMMRRRRSSREQGVCACIYICYVFVVVYCWVFQRWIQVVVVRDLERERDSIPMGATNTVY